MVRFEIKLEKIRNHKRCRLAESSSGDFQTESKHWLVLEFENSVSPFKARRRKKLYMYLKTVCGNVCQDVSPLSRKRKHGGNLYSRESERLSWKKTLVFKLLSAQAKEELTTNLTGKDPQGGNENINRNPWKQKKKILKGGKTASS